MVNKNTTNVKTVYYEQSTNYFLGRQKHYNDLIQIYK